MTRAARLADRNRAIWELHLGGWAQERIAVRYGLSQSQVSRIITATRRAIPAQERADLIQTEIARLDAALTVCWQIMERGSRTGEEPAEVAAVLGAVDRILAVSRERRRLLGLDAVAPTQTSRGVRYEIVGLDPAQLA